jgi:hypothetical protein
MSTAEHHARAWTDALAESVLEPLLPATQERLQLVPWIRSFDSPRLASSALMARLASGYSLGETPDDLIGRLASAAAHDGRSLDTDVATAIVLTAVQMVRSATLPDPRWWEPLLLAEHLAIACARIELGTQGDARALLRDRLWLPETMWPDALTRAEHPAGINYAADRAAAGPLAARLESLAQAEEARTIVIESLGRLGEDAGGRLDLALAVGQREQLRVTHRLAKRRADGDLVAFLETEAARFVAACRGLSSLERELMRLVNNDEQPLIRAARLAKRFVVVAPGEGSSPLPDLLGGHRHLPRQLDLFFGLGTHTLQRRSGPIISWSVIFEGALPDGFIDDEPTAIGVGRTDATDGVELALRFSFSGEPVEVPIIYPGASPNSTLSLAVLALTQVARLDVYVRDRRRGISHVSQGAVVLEDPLYSDIVQRAATACRKLLVDGEQAATEMITHELSDGSGAGPAIGFLLNDAGKSEQLLEAQDPAAALGPCRTATREDTGRLSTARRAMLKAEARRVEHSSATAERDAAAAHDAYVRVVQMVRGQRPSVAMPGVQRELERLVAGVVTARRAAVHLSLSTTGLEAIWADRVDEDLHIERIVLDDVDVPELQCALLQPGAGSIDLIDRPGGAGIALGARIGRALAYRGVRELLICPTRFLHQLPFHALRLNAENDDRLLDHADVIYAPSCAVAGQLLQTPARPGTTVVTAVDLHHARDEATVVGALADNPRLLIGDAATPAAVLESLQGAARLHVCSHGHYDSKDFLASRLDLAPSSRQTGRLTVARILADADLRGMDMVVLGACLSGAPIGRI